MTVQLFGKTLNKGGRGGTLEVMPTVLTSLQAQLSADHQPDPTLGTPFASRAPSSDWSTVAQMGPGQPATPFPIGGEPRQWVYRVGWNFPTPPDSDRRIDGQLLRDLADNTFLIRRAIEIRKEELAGLKWDIVPSEEALLDDRFGKTQQERGRAIRTKYGDMMREIRAFFKYPEGYYTTYDGSNWIRKGTVAWKDWLNAVVEDYMVGDWVTIWPEKTLGGKLLSLARVDGEHTKVLLNLDGRLPPPPMPAYQQYLYGVPRANFTQDQLYFWPRNLRNITPYGFSHVEQCMILILLLLRYDQFNLAMYNDSTLPMGILEAPANQTPDQIKDIADFLNGAVGTINDKMRIYPAPNGTKWQPIKPFTFDEKFASYVIDLAALAMGMTRQELGFGASGDNVLSGTGQSEQQADLEKRRSLIPTARWIEEKMNRVIRDHWGVDAVEFRFTELVVEDLKEKYEAKDIAIRSGQVSLDQVIEELGGEGIGMGHIVETNHGLMLPELGLIVTAQGVQQLPMNSDEAKTFLAQQQEQQAAKAKRTKPQPAQPPPEDDTADMKQKVAALAQNPTSQSEGDDKRKKREEEFLAAWLLLMRKKRQAILEMKRKHKLLTSHNVRAAFSFSPDERAQFQARLLETRTDAYQDELDALPTNPLHDAKPKPVTGHEAAKRLVDSTYNHVDGIIATWDSDVSKQADQLEAQGADVDQLTDALIDWVKDREAWKGKQIGTTEVTDAMGMAQEDWARNNPGMSVGLMRWHTHQDDEVCDECRALDGQLVDPRKTRPGIHPNCRCWLTPP